MILPDYKNSIANLPNSVLKYFGVETVGDTLPIFDTLLEKTYKNVVVLLLDGLGISTIHEHLKEDGAFLTHLKGEYSSTFIATTVAATTSALSGLQPCEHSWLGWDCYFPQIDKTVTVYLNSVTGTKTPAADYNVAWKYIPYENVIERLNKAGHKAYAVTPFFPPNPQTFEEIIEHIKDHCKEPERKYIYAYWPSPDDFLHLYGGGSKEVFDNMKYLEDKVSALADELEDTLLVVTADHGHINSDSAMINDYPKITECLERIPSFEPRALNFFVKKGKEEQFKDEFNKEFGDKFVLMTREEVFDKKLFGTGKEHPRFRSMVGDYIAIAVSDLSLYYTDEETLKSVHAGMTENEMKIPFIVFGEK
ncbi:MAG: alkaline phosphatase family protein [Clostridiales bacterium]|nr:alkaline phosphatase family protein [Clostridiales bacterium]